jgi:integrase
MDIHGYSNGFGKWYQRFNRRHVTKDPQKVFHSMRHLVTDTLKQAGVLETVIAELVGHSNGGSETMGRVWQEVSTQGAPGSTDEVGLWCHIIKGFNRTQ